jgi:small-conductance mechanosensitive channel
LIRIVGQVIRVFRLALRPPPLLVLLALGWSSFARGEEPPTGGAAVRVHDHDGFVFRVPDGLRTPEQRAAEASQTFSAVVDDDVAGALTIDLAADEARVLVGTRQLFRLVPADAAAAGEASLSTYAPRVQASLDSFLLKERRRVQLQRFVLSASLVVALGLLAYLLLRWLYRLSRSWEAHLLAPDSGLAARLRRMGIASTERVRALLVLAIDGGRVAVGVASVYALLVFSLSLFERTKAWSSVLAAWAAAPFLAFGRRLLHALPNLLLLVVLGAVLRGGWRAMTVAFDRIAGTKDEVAGIRSEFVVPYRLLARTALVLASLLLLPLLAGAENELPSQVGMVLLGALALSAIPLVATTLLGIYVLLAQEYRLGEWLEVEVAGRPVSGEVTRVDFLHVRLVPAGGGEVRLPHLRMLVSPVTRRVPVAGLEVVITIALESMAPGRALEALRAAADRVRSSAQLPSPAEVVLRELAEAGATFLVTVPSAPPSLRTELLLALHEATQPGMRA